MEAVDPTLQDGARWDSVTSIMRLSRRDLAGALNRIHQCNKQHKHKWEARRGGGERNGQVRRSRETPETGTRPGSVTHSPFCETEKSR